MKAKEIRELSVEELEVKLTELKKDLFNLRLQHATNQLDNPSLDPFCLEPTARARARYLRSFD